MKKYNVHFNVMASYDIEVEANSVEEAEALARTKYEIASMGDFDWVDENSCDIEEL